MTDTVTRALRKRLASTIQLRLGHAGAPVSSTVASALAGQAMKDANLDALTGYVAAIESGADPAAAREQLAGNPITEQLLVVEP